MKNHYIIYILSLCFLSNISWGQNILEEKLIYRGNLAFHQESDEPVTGIVISKYETGETIEKGEYVDGLREFEWKEFHQNGTVKSTINYKNGFKEGPFEIYFEEKIMSILLDSTNLDQESILTEALQHIKKRNIL